MVELLQMWALVEVFGIICLPLTVTIFHNLPDHGWAFTKAIGIALLAFCVGQAGCGTPFAPAAGNGSARPESMLSSPTVTRPMVKKWCQGFEWAKAARAACAGGPAPRRPTPGA